MGKTYIIGEYSEKYLKKLKAEERYGTTGILLGQVTPLKTYIIFAAQTPLKDQAELPPDNPDEMNASDIEWVSEHARQVARMLPGGILVLGIFLIRPAKMSKEEAQDIFRKLTSAVETAVAKERLWTFSEEEPPERIVLQVYADSKKMKLRTYDIHNPLTPTKLLDCKSSNLSSAWQLVEATVNVDIHIPVTTADNQFDNASLKGLNAWAKHMMESSYLINGHYKDPESIISEGVKKKSPVEVQFLSAPATVSSDDTSAVIQRCSSSIAVKGTVHCRAYLHGSKTKVKDGILSLKRDVLNTVFVRCEMVFEDQILNRNADAGDSTSHKAPHRVFASILPSSVAFCDYGFSDEGSKDLEERFKELLDYELHPAQVDRTEEVLLEEMGIDTGQEQEQAPLKEEEEEITDTGFKYTGMAAAAGVGVIAVAASVIYYFIGAAI